MILKRHNPIGSDEIEAVNEVLKSGILSDFLGAESKKFYGGKRVLEFEEEAKEFFKVDHAISVNSWTSGLICTVGSLDVEPGDEIITTPWTMCATATSILHWNAIPIFADIDKDSFCISPDSIKSCLSSKTKAIIGVDIFGQSADYEAIRNVIPENVKIISDTAQAPGAIRNGKICGTLSDIGGYSFNYHKHIHTGEGGLIVTNDEKLAERCRLIRNHAEAVIESRPSSPINNMIGFNFRMGEIEAAIAKCQLNKLDVIVKNRQKIADIITGILAKVKGIQCPQVSTGNTHVYYMYSLILDENLDRKNIVSQLVKKGIEGVSEGYTNIHRLPVFLNKKAYGNSSIPWNLNKKNYLYGNGTCPIAEKYHDKQVFTLALNHFDMDENDAVRVANLIKDVIESQ